VAGHQTAFCGCGPSFRERSSSEVHLRSRSGEHALIGTFSWAIGAELSSWPACPVPDGLKLSRRFRIIKALLNENKPYGQNVRQRFDGGCLAFLFLNLQRLEAREEPPIIKKWTLGDFRLSSIWAGCSNDQEGCTIPGWGYKRTFYKEQDHEENTGESGPCGRIRYG
jgi:hypothetical protein